ncbi:la protein 1-like [Zingiber officinale]|uniref:La protein 1 n=1 Tax=Zingiber officinale TaxID=94328 RepID=A0A8J5KWB1_ZINOF|nr:la protein 1-like [Zingiber officinale]KAG6493068.1 hypothetical protein ZIOFF_048042 [Zingiber officinale]
MAAATPLDEAKAKNVLRQVEFYFSDSNLPRDKFLKQSVQENEDGLVSLSLICSFTRMKNHLGLDAALKPENIPEEIVLAVADVLRSSTSLRISEDGKRVGRSTNLVAPEEILELVDSKTVAASPLPYDVKIEDIHSFFAQCGKVNSVRLPRHVFDKRHICGTALIEFSEEVDATKILQEKLVFAGAELELQPKKDFDLQREKKRGEAEKFYNRSSSDESYPKGLIIAFKLKKKQDDKPLEQNTENKVNENKGGSTSEEVEDTGNEENKEKGEEAGKLSDVNIKNDEDMTECLSEKIEEEATDEVKHDTEDKEDKSLPVDKSKNTNDGSIVTREDIKQLLEKFGTVKFVDFRMGEELGYVRFEDPESATKARAAAVLVEGGFIVKDYVATLEALTGDAEKEYWNLLRGNQEKRKENKSNRGRGGRFNRGGRGHGGKRPHHTNPGEKHPNKAQKIEA